MLCLSASILCVVFNGGSHRQEKSVSKSMTRELTHCTFIYAQLVLIHGMYTYVHLHVYILTPVYIHFHVQFSQYHTTDTCTTVSTISFPIRPLFLQHILFLLFFFYVTSSHIKLFSCKSLPLLTDYYQLHLELHKPHCMLFILVGSLTLCCMWLYTCMYACMYACMHKAISRLHLS